MKNLLDPTIPNKDGYVAGGKHAGLDLELDDLTQGSVAHPKISAPNSLTESWPWRRDAICYLATSGVWRCVGIQNGTRAKT
jgi:hypothetical protein